MGYRVLIVDDSKLARMSIGKALDALHPDWVRLEAANADEALALVGDADLTVLDFNMPGRNGLELASQLRASHPEMPVALISANHQVEIVRQARDVGAAFLPKPVTGEALRVFLEDAVRRLGSAGR
jgi:CheY-like chemotaxis protein